MRSLRVLLVEDERDLRELLTETLTEEGFTVESAADGAQALDAATRGEFTVDVLITDVRMPVMDGLRLVCALRERGITVPTIIWSTAPHLCEDDVNRLFDEELRSGRLALMVKWDVEGLRAFLHAACSD